MRQFTFWQRMQMRYFPRPHELSPQRRRYTCQPYAHSHEEPIELTRRLIEKHPEYALLPPILEKLCRLIDLSCIASEELVKFNATRCNKSKRKDLTVSERKQFQTYQHACQEWYDLCRGYWILIWSLYDSWLPCFEYSSIIEELVSISNQLDAKIWKLNVLLQNST
jgi:hypothetical protein